MFRSKKWVIWAVLAASLQLITYYQVADSAEPKNGPAKIEPIKGGNSRITLTSRAAERLDIQTVKLKEERVPVRGQNGNRLEPRKIVPYSTVLYDPQGVAWTYTSPGPLVFVREKIIIDYIDGDKAVLTDGPPVGTEVVTVGAIELYGAETGIGK